MDKPRMADFQNDKTLARCLSTSPQACCNLQPDNVLSNGGVHCKHQCHTAVSASWCLLGSRSLALLLAGKEHAVDVGQNTTACDGHIGKQLAELFIIANRQLNVAWHNPALLVVLQRR